MRPEASNQFHPPPSFSLSQSLPNPLIDAAATTGERTPEGQRFSFYTDPMAAVSGSKRKQPYSSSPSAFSSPIRSPTPLSHPSNRPCAGPRNYHVPGTQPPGFQFQTSPSPDQSLWRSQFQFHSPFSGQTGGTSPSSTSNSNSWNRSGGGSSGHGFHPGHSSRGRGLPSPGFRNGGSASPCSNSGRGTGWQFTSRPQQSGGRGRGSRHSNCSAPNDSRHFYKTVMKDPWRKLKPIIGSILVTRSGSGSWLPKSIAAPKRTKVVESGSKSRLSLAESLALSLQEAADDM